MGEIVWDIHETLGYAQVLQLVAALCPLYPEHLAALGRDASRGDQAALSIVDLHPKTVAASIDRSHMDRRRRPSLKLPGHSRVVRDKLLSIGHVPLPHLGRDHEITRVSIAQQFRE